MGLSLGDALLLAVGLADGSNDTLGLFDRALEGACEIVGLADAMSLGPALGCTDSVSLGRPVGCSEATVLGFCDGLAVTSGLAVGDGVGGVTGGSTLEVSYISTSHSSTSAAGPSSAKRTMAFS